MPRAGASIERSWIPISPHAEVEIPGVAELVLRMIVLSRPEPRYVT
jgi:hypothetical protein